MTNLTHVLYAESAHEAVLHQVEEKDAMPRTCMRYVFGLLSNVAKPPTKASQPPNPLRKTTTMMATQPSAAPPLRALLSLLAHTRCHTASLNMVDDMRDDPRVNMASQPASVTPKPSGNGCGIGVLHGKACWQRGVRNTRCVNFYT
eukprot:GHUV01039828.1.p1 GENE.GHUV01039828.1~~GHUV01039828.1.p1  ORF type:complete len:146 (-),score=24.00 GHUV01039828.1:345-782(-)